MVLSASKKPKTQQAGRPIGTSQARPIALINNYEAVISLTEELRFMQMAV
jgi:hypothetical protein